METHVDLFVFSDQSEIDSEIGTLFKSLCFNNDMYIKNGVDGKKLMLNFFNEKRKHNNIDPLIINYDDVILLDFENIDISKNYISGHIVSNSDAFEKSEKIVKQFSDVGFSTKIFIWADETRYFVSCKPNEDVRAIDFEDLPYDGLDDDEIDDLDFDEIDVAEKLSWWHENKPQLLAFIPDLSE